MENLVQMKSPFDGGPVKEVSTMEAQTFRGETFNVHVRYYVSVNGGEQFTSEAQDTMTFNDLYSQYRNKHGIPYPEEIRQIRERYKLSYKQISTLLGFGINQYAQYERGQVPNISNGKMIRSLRDKKTAMDYLQNCRGAFSEKEYEKIYANILLAKDDEPIDTLDFVFGRAPYSIENGFVAFQKQKASEMVKYFILEAGCTFPSKLNKVMFYADFNHFKIHLSSISGLRYQALPYGIVPYKFSTLYDNIEGISFEIISAHGKESRKLFCTDYDLDVFSEEERETMARIAAMTKDMPTQQIVDENHKETLWLNHQEKKEFVPYSEAFDLQSLIV